MASIPLNAHLPKLKQRVVFWSLPILALIAAWLIVVDRGSCAVVVYNQTNEAQQDVQVRVGATAIHFGAIEPAESRRQSLAPSSSAGVVRLSWLGSDSSTQPDFTFEPGPGRQLVVRIEPGNYVFYSAQESFWNRLEQTLR